MKGSLVNPIRASADGPMKNIPTNPLSAVRNGPVKTNSHGGSKAAPHKGETAEQAQIAAPPGPSSRIKIPKVNKNHRPASPGIVMKSTEAVDKAYSNSIKSTYLGLIK